MGSRKRVLSLSLSSPHMHPGDPDLRSQNCEGKAMSVLLTIMIASLDECSSVRVVLDKHFCSTCFELQSKWELKR